MSGPNHGDEIQIFAECLSFANVVNIFVQLPTPRDNTTFLNRNDRHLRLEHCGRTASIELPLESIEVDVLSCLPEYGSCSRSSRFQVVNGGVYSVTDAESEAPWSASCLDSNISLGCGYHDQDGRQCGAIIVARGRVVDWRDLPSTGWAEMMDLWFCHKPHEQDATNSQTFKGYAAGNTRLARRGIGFVDPLRLLLDQADCGNIEVDERDLVSCAACKSILGRIDQTGAWLYKPQLQLNSLSDTSEAIAQEIWLATYLQSRDIGPKRFYTAHSMLELWIFSSRLAYSNSLSTTSDGRAQHGLKVLYRPITDDDIPAQHELLTRSSLAREELGLSPELEDLLLPHLREANKILPHALKQFQGWDVALLSLPEPRTRG